MSSLAYVIRQRLTSQAQFVCRAIGLAPDVHQALLIVLCRRAAPNYNEDSRGL
jgi:hypothetical protein